MTHHLIFGLLLLGAALAKPVVQYREKYKGVVREIKAIQAQKIVVNDDIDVLLLQDTSATIYVQGKENFVDKIEATVEGNTIILHSVKKSGVPHKVIAYVPVQHLKELEVNGDSYVKSAGQLETPYLNVLFNNNCKVALKTTGVIETKAAPGIELIVEKNIPVVTAMARKVSNSIKSDSYIGPLLSLVN